MDDSRSMRLILRGKGAIYASAILLAAGLTVTSAFAQSGVFLAAGNDAPERIVEAADFWGWRVDTYEYLTDVVPPNLPFFGMGGSRFAGGVWTSASKRPEMCVAYGTGSMGSSVVAGGGDTIPRINFQQEDDGGTPIARAIANITPGKPVTVWITWGWGHGGYSASEPTVLYINEMLKMGRPARKLGKSKAWLGDLNSLQGESAMFPEIKSGSANGDGWTYLPNRYIAYIWRAYNARHPTRKIVGKPTQMGNSDLPSLEMLAPARFYTVGGPVYRGTTDSIVTFSAQSDDYTDFVKFEAYDGDSLLFTVDEPKGVAGFSKRVQFQQQGIYGLHVIGTRKEGQKINTRPSLYFVRGPKRGNEILKIITTGEPNSIDDGIRITSPALVPTTLGANLPTWTWKAAPQVDGFYSGNTYNLSGNGHAIYMCWDRAGYAYVKEKLKGDFVFYARLLDAGEDPGTVGLTLKSTLSGKSPVLDLRWDWFWKNQNGSGLAWFNRHTPSSYIGEHDQGEKGQCSSYPTSQHGGENKICIITQPDYNCLGRGLENQVPGFTSPSGIWMAVQRKGDIYHLYARKDGDTAWTHINPIHKYQQDIAKRIFPNFILPEAVDGEVFVGLSVVGVNYGEHLQKARWDSITLIYDTTAARAWSAGTPTDIADRTGSAKRATAKLRIEGRSLLHLPGDVKQIAIYDLAGQLVQSRKLEAGGAVRLSRPLAPGAYQALVYTRDGGVALSSLPVR